MANESVPQKQDPPKRLSSRRAASATPFSERLLDSIRFFSETITLGGQALATIFTGRFALRDLLTQMSSIGVDATGIVLIMAATSGSVFALYTASLASSMGFTEIVGGTLAYAFLNELGPVLGGIAYAARSGAAISAEIGTMVVTEQVDALRAMAVSPIRYLVAPKVLAAVIMLPLLTVLADVVGVSAGMLSSSLNGIPVASFISSVYKYANSADLVNGVIKSLVFAFLIAIVACQQGLKTRGGATGVGRSTTRSVVLCVMLITIADVFLANLLKNHR